MSLSGLKVSEGTLQPAFKPEITEYTMTLDESVNQIAITPECFDLAAKLNVDGNITVSGQASKQVPITGGLNIVNVIVNGHDGLSSRIYTLKIKSMKKVSVDGNVNAAFNNKKCLNVSGRMGTEAKQPVTLMIRSPKNEIVYIGSLDTTAGGNFNLQYTMDQWQYGTYTVRVGKEGLYQPLFTSFDIKQSKPYLENLTVSGGKLTPGFEATKDSYAVAVENKITAIDITAVTQDPLAVMTVNGQEVPSGVPSSKIPLEVGSNRVEITVTTLDGATKVYVIDVTRLTLPVFVPEKESKPVPTPPTPDPDPKPPTPDPDPKPPTPDPDPKPPTPDPDPKPPTPDPDPKPPIPDPEPMDDATLNDLQVTGGELSMPFDKTVMFKTVRVVIGTPSVTLKPITSSSKAKLNLICIPYEIDRNPMPKDPEAVVTDIQSGVFMDPIQGADFHDYRYIQVTSGDGQEVNYYRINIIYVNPPPPIEEGE